MKDGFEGLQAIYVQVFEIIQIAAKEGLLKPEHYGKWMRFEVAFQYYGPEEPVNLDAVNMSPHPVASPTPREGGST